MSKFYKQIRELQEYDSKIPELQFEVIRRKKTIIEDEDRSKAK